MYSDYLEQYHNMMTTIFEYLDGTSVRVQAYNQWKIFVEKLKWWNYYIKGEQ